MRSKAFYLGCLLLFLAACDVKSPDQFTSTRPSDFPDIFVTPSNAAEVHYHQSSMGYSVMSYLLDEEYPAQKTINEFSAELQRKGYVQIRWSPNDLVVYEISVEDNVKKYKKRDIQPEPLDEDTAESLSAPTWRKEKFGREELSYIYLDEWISPNDELMVNDLKYVADDGELENKLIVHRHFWPKGSGKDRYIQKYKELHPDEFDK